MKFLNKLERKLGRYAIHNLINYVIAIYVVGIFIDTVNPTFYSQYLALNIGSVLKGEVWRLFTYIFQASSNLTSGFSIFFIFIEMYLYWMIGRSLEQSWGAFRFNLYYLSGILFNILAAFILYMFGFQSNYPLGLMYINRSLFFAFAALFPNMQFLLFYVIPVKVKYLAYIYAAMIAFDVIRYITAPGGLVIGISIMVALANFLVFFLATRNYKRMSPKEYKRKADFKRAVKSAKGITKHKCAVCGRTEKDDESLEFRFCSKCDGNYEYCMEHLFTHEHIKHNH